MMVLLILMNINLIDAMTYWLLNNMGNSRIEVPILMWSSCGHARMYRFYPYSSGLFHYRWSNHLLSIKCLNAYGAMVIIFYL